MENANSTQKTAVLADSAMQSFALQVQLMDVANVKKFMDMQGHVPLIFSAKISQNPGLLRTICDSLGYITTKNVHHCKELSNAGGVDALVNLCAPRYPIDVRICACSALFIISAEVEYRTVISQTKVVENVSELIVTSCESQSPSVFCFCQSINHYGQNFNHKNILSFL